MRPNHDHICYLGIALSQMSQTPPPNANERQRQRLSGSLTTVVRQHDLNKRHLRGCSIPTFVLRVVERIANFLHAYEYVVFDLKSNYIMPITR